MTSYVWTVDPDHPQGWPRPMTPAEQAVHDADQSTGATVAAQQATWNANESTIQQAIVGRLAQIRTARTALSGGTIFGSLSAPERAVIDGLLQDDIYLGRLALELFDATT